MLRALLLALSVAADPVTLARRPAPAIAPPPADRAIAAPTATRRDDPPGDDVPDRWFGADKVRHFFVAGFVESVGYALARRAGASGDGALATGVGLGVAVSIGKEAHDRRAGRPFSVRDLVWDAAGLLAHGALLAQVDG